MDHMVSLSPVPPKSADIDNARRVTSSDGTVIGYGVSGTGPGVVLVQGAMGTAQNYEQLAQSMSGRFTVYRPDRRGRGMSPKTYDPQHTIDRDVEDLAAVLTATGTRFVFGLSSGAMIVLEGLRAQLPISKAAVYEPPFYLAGISHRLIERFDREIENNQLDMALVTASRIVKLGPRLLSFVPRALLRLGTARLLRSDALKGSSPYATLRELLPAMRYDFNIVGDSDGRLTDFKDVQAPVLLLGGDKSPSYLAEALGALEGTLPESTRLEFKGLDHSGSWNRDRGGDPTTVARALCEFFAR